MKVLDGLPSSVGDRRLLTLAQTEELWNAYIGHLRGGDSGRRQWPASQRELVQRHLDCIREELDDVPAVWLVLVDQHPVGIELAAKALLPYATGLLVSRAGDLMLTSFDARDGLCVELNYQPWGDEYESAAWGVFERGGGVD